MAVLECYVCGKQYRTSRTYRTQGWRVTLIPISLEHREKYVEHIFTEDHIATEIRETTCQICGFKSSKVSELADHLSEPCRPEWLEALLRNSSGPLQNSFNSFSSLPLGPWCGQTDVPESTWGRRIVCRAVVKKKLSVKKW